MYGRYSMKTMVRRVLVILILFLMPFIKVDAHEDNFTISKIESSDVTLLAESKDVSCYNAVGNNLFQQDNGINGVLEKEDVTESFSVKNRDNPSNYNLTLGTLTDSITQQNSYKIYPLELDENQYLQARLIVPNDSSVDYDLVLYNSSFSVIKYSNQYSLTYNNNVPIPESLGYISTSDQTVYLVVFLYSNNSNAKTYTLDIAISDSNLDLGETDDNPNEVTDTNLYYASYITTRKINSPVDYDWYKFTVMDDINYSKIRLLLTFDNTPTNGCQLDLYENVASGQDAYAMYHLGSGNSGEIELDPGEYYLRVSSTESLNDFDIDDAITTYNLYIEPCSPIDNIHITSKDGPNGWNVDYGDGLYLRIDEANPSYIDVSGRATYMDNLGLTTGAYNTLVDCEVRNNSWITLNHPELAYNHTLVRTNSSGYFSARIYLNPGAGYNVYYNAVVGSYHHYDIMTLTVSNYYNGNQSDSETFYLLTSPVSPE